MDASDIIHTNNTEYSGTKCTTNLIQSVQRF